MTPKDRGSAEADRSTGADPTKDAEFQKVVGYFLRTPPKPHSAEPKRKRLTDEEMKAKAIDRWNNEGGAKGKPQKRGPSEKPSRSQQHLDRPRELKS